MAYFRTIAPAADKSTQVIVARRVASPSQFSVEARRSFDAPTDHDV